MGDLICRAIRRKAIVGRWAEREGRPRFAGGTFSCPNLQRGHLERMAWLMTEEPGQLTTLRAEIRGALPRVTDRAARLHLEDAQVRITDILDPRD